MSDRYLKMSAEIPDTKLSDEDAANTFLAREIVQEIRKFGVSQLTLEKIIEILALEIESRGKMLAIIGAVRGNVETNDSPIECD